MAAGQEKTTDAERFTKWVRAHGRAVRGYLLGMVRRPDIADDLAQEVFYRAWKARTGYCEQGTARAYLLRIADRLVVDRGRRSGTETTMDDASWTVHEPTSPAPDPVAAIAHAEAVERLAAAMETLSDSQRRILLLRYYGQFSFEEIASIVGCPLSTALSHCRRGLQALRKLMVEETP